MTYRSSSKAAKLSVVLNKTRVTVPQMQWVAEINRWLFDLPQSQLKLQEMINYGTLDVHRQPRNTHEKAVVPRKMDITISVTDPEFVVVEDRTRRDTNAIVLKFFSVLTYRNVPNGLVYTMCYSQDVCLCIAYID